MTMNNKPVNYQINTKDHLQGEYGVFYTYVMAADGLYIRAMNDLLAVTMNIAHVEVRGLAPLKEEIIFRHGKLPSYLLNLALSIISETPETEQYVAIVWSKNSYAVRKPEQDGTGGRVKYNVIPGTLMDIHSHTGEMPAEFSFIDNIDEQGFKLYAVAADTGSDAPPLTIRLGVFGYFLELGIEEVFEGYGSSNTGLQAGCV
jgi:hypothetical protein